MDFERLCKDVMNIDSKIRFSMVVIDGKQKYGGYRFDTVGILDSDELESSIWYAYERMVGRRAHEFKLGKTRYAFTEYANVKRVTFPLDQKTLLLVSMELDAAHDSIIRDILKLIATS
ncbi:MAG: hypothetical protein K5793_08645 [Nitrosarchaeum sp.]|nr:hypothetical protein [Nitrosarchaeum sp.]